jgi:death-on-curing protein
VTYYLTLEDITELGLAVLAAEGEEFLVADPGLLQSALARPQATVFGQDAYGSLTAKAAALMESLARNHCLVDGNKRIAWAATKLFLLFNDVYLRAVDVNDAEQYVVGVAEGTIGLQLSEATIQMWSTQVSPSS